MSRNSNLKFINYSWDILQLKGNGIILNDKDDYNNDNCDDDGCDDNDFDDGDDYHDYSDKCKLVYMLSIPY